jgi:hypothetical protein
MVLLLQTGVTYYLKTLPQRYSCQEDVPMHLGCHKLADVVAYVQRRVAQAQGKPEPVFNPHTRVYSEVLETCTLEGCDLAGMPPELATPEEMLQLAEVLDTEVYGKDMLVRELVSV